MALTRRIHRGGKPTKGKKGKGHCTKGGKKTMRKGGKSLLVPATFLTALLAFGKKKKKTQKRKSKRGGFLENTLDLPPQDQYYPASY